MQLVKVDLDEHPSLAKVYGVVSVPHVVFIDSGGLIVDRLKTFEAPRPFRKRLKRLLASDSGRKTPPTAG